MRDLIGCIDGLQSKLEKHKNTDLKETPTRNIFIDPLLQTLGWDVSDWDKVQTEYPTIDGKSVDYACKIDGKAVLLIEAKQLIDPLSDVRGTTQIISYAVNDGIDWCILTNGIKYKVYFTRGKGAAPDKLLFEVSLDPKENNGMSNQQVAEYLSRFSEVAMVEHNLDKLGEDFFTKLLIHKALDKIFRDPPDALVKQIPIHYQ